MQLKYRKIDYVCSKPCNLAILQLAICQNDNLDELKNNYIIYIINYIYNIIKLYILFAFRQKKQKAKLQIASCKIARLQDFMSQVII